MNYREAIRYLYNIQKYGIKLGLSTITGLMAMLGNPHQSFRSIHVAGTNGKGSTSAIMAALLMSAGFRVGLFTSPHLISFTERIRVNNREITEEEVISLTDNLKSQISNLESDRFNPTFFEFVTAMAFLYFQSQKTDAGVIEVGMGGRLDSTNIITPEVSVITNISYDHTEFLGGTLAEIANEKAGIIKDCIPVVCSSQPAECLEALLASAEKKNAPVYLHGKDFSSSLNNEDSSGIYFDYHSEDSEMHGLHLPLSGAHQAENAAVAIKAAELFFKRCPPRSSLVPDFIPAALESVRWPGRMEMISKNPPVLIDGAHNPAAAEALSTAIRSSLSSTYKQIILVLGIMGDKDIRGIMKPLLPLASDIILTAPGYERSASPVKLQKIAKELGYPETQIAYTMQEALESAVTISKFAAKAAASALIVVTGSFYTIGEAKEVFGQSGVLTRLRESR
jgi:dihydrofolate synthase/folylpolyglutamate synthase